MRVFGGRRHRASASLSAILTTAALSLPLTSCGDDPVVVVEWPELNGQFQYRSLMPVDASGLTCVEHGDITINHPGADTFTASGDITMDCWVGNSAIPAPDGVVEFSNGQFDPETNRDSWPMTWEGRPSWSYSGEVFWATPAQMRAYGTGQGVVDLPDGSQVSRDFTWTICRRFVYQNDMVEQVCDFS